MVPPTKRFIYLVSGLSLAKHISYSHQLELLARHLTLRGHHALLIGKSRVQNFSGYPVPASSENLLKLELTDYTGNTLKPLLENYPARATILLGYPDQFDFFVENKHGYPVYLWAQFSRTPAILPKHVDIIPLTYLTAIHVVNAGGALPRAIIPHGVDSNRFQPISRAAKASAKERIGYHFSCSIVLCVGANSTRKRYDLLLEAFSRVYHRVKDAHLLIKTDRDARPGGFNLAKIAGDAGIAERVKIITGDVSVEELSLLYGISDVYVHPAEWEGFGIPVIEAMACGLPVLTHPVQGPGEIIHSSDLLTWKSKVILDGEVVLRRVDPAALAERIVETLTNHELAKKVGRLGRHTVVKRYDIRRVAELWENTMRTFG